MSLSSIFKILLMFSTVGSSFSEDEASPQGCTYFFEAPFTPLCDLGTALGVVVPAAVVQAALVSLILALLLLCRLSRIVEAEKRSRVAPLLLMLAAIFGLCSLSFVYLMERGQNVCITQYALLTVLCVLCIACLLTQGVRLHWLAQKTRSPSIRALGWLTVALAVTQSFAGCLWVIAIAVNQTQLTCQSQLLDFTLAFLCILVLLSAALSGVAYGRYRKQQQWKCTAAWLLAAWLTSALLWAAGLTFHLYANAALSLPSTWGDLEHALVLVVQAWLLLLLYAIPETHACLRPAPQPSLPCKTNATKAPAHVTLSGFSEDVSLSSWQFGENSGIGAGPSATSGNNIDQATKITIVDEGAVTSYGETAADDGEGWTVIPLDD